MKRTELVEYLDDYLRIHDIRDYGPQGLQVEGRQEVNRVVGMVDAHLPSVEVALTLNADLLLVHHGILWGGAQRLQGGYARLVRALLGADLNLYAAHLALDGHPEVGNNVELARRLGLEVSDWWAMVQGSKIGVIGTAPDGVKFDYLCDRFEQAVAPPLLVQSYGPRVSHRVAILSGYGAKEIAEAAQLGCDTVVTGETSHSNFYDAQDYGVNLIYGGHYATETVGVQALGEHLAARFGLEFVFEDLPTGL
jgi:dinuclear metal center YbgI/SA1388 family protein